MKGGDAVPWGEGLLDSQLWPEQVAFPEIDPLKTWKKNQFSYFQIGKWRLRDEVIQSGTFLRVKGGAKNTYNYTHVYILKYLYIIREICFIIILDIK